MHYRQQSIGDFLNMKSKMKPYHTSFPQFPNLPTELRAIIWKLSLQSRVIEIEFKEARGFYTRVGTPVALRVCRDSRDAVISSYPVCFGNIMFEPRTIFNFSLDTLYIDNNFQGQTLHLLGSLSATEISKLQRLAIDDDLNEDYEIGGDAEIDYEGAVRKAATSMPSLKILQQVFNIYVWVPNIEEGNGPTKFFRKWPAKVERMHICEDRHRCECGEFHGYDSDDEPDELCALHELPHADDLLPLPNGPNAPKVTAIWGWRPTK